MIEVYFVAVIILLLFAAFGLFACNNETEVELNNTPIDLAAVEKAVDAAADAYLEASKNLNTDYIDSVYHENGIFIGTDPEEYWSKDTIMSLYKKLLEDTSINFDITIHKRVINVDHDGKSALVTEQSFHDHISKDVYVRTITRYINIDDTWKIDYINWSLAPTNDQLRFIWKAFKEKEE